MIISVLKEEYKHEQRVALVPAHLPALTKAGATIQIQAGAGLIAGFKDADYQEKGAVILAEEKDLLQKADIILSIRAAGANPSVSSRQAAFIPKGASYISLMNPYQKHKVFAELLAKQIRLFSLELVPRTTRAQAVDVLSSMASLSGYQAVLIAASHSMKIFPQMITPAGTIPPARAFVIGAGVAGLQAIATARRLGAMVRAYDVREASKEQVESLGARFLSLALESTESETTGGYAKAMDENFYQKQRELMTSVLKESNVVITTAAIPGKKSPILITKEMVEVMPKGSIIVDLAAERGGNCELSKPGKVIDHEGVAIHAPLNLASALATDASIMFSKNVSQFVLSLIKEGKLAINYEDDIVQSTLLCEEGRVVQDRFSSQFGK